MTRLADAGTVMDILAERVTTATNRNNVASSFVAADPHSLLAGFAVDPAAPTNEEKAKLFLDTLFTWAKQVHHSVTKGTQLETDAPAAETAGDDAVTADL